MSDSRTRPAGASLHLGMQPEGGSARRGRSFFILIVGIVWSGTAWLAQPFFLQSSITDLPPSEVQFLWRSAQFSELERVGAARTYPEIHDPVTCEMR